MVQGSDLYTIQIKIDRLPAKIWAALKKRCAGEIGTVIELLQGKLSTSAMAIITDQEGGMFPSPKQITMNCSCPDIAGLCKHLAAVLYGVGSRLDTQPELLFKLRQVNHLHLIPTADSVAALTKTSSSSRQTLATTELADVFGVEIDTGGADSSRHARSHAANAKNTIAPSPQRREPVPSPKKSHTPARAKTKKTAASTQTPLKKKTHVQRTAAAVAATQPRSPANKGQASGLRERSPR